MLFILVAIDIDWISMYYTDDYLSPKLFQINNLFLLLKL